MRKSFKSSRAALQFEAAQKELAHPKPKALGRRSPHLLSARYLGALRYKGPGQAAKRLIAQAGSIQPSRLSQADVTEIDEAIYKGNYAHSTKATYAHSLRQILRWLWEEHGTPKLDQHVRRYQGIRPRNVTASREEIDALLAAAPDHLRLWILLCSDLALRSGTAARLGPRHYYHSNHTLQFTTKANAHLTLPVTQEIRELIERCSMDTPVSFVRQLWELAPPLHRTPPHESRCNGWWTPQFQKLRKELKINHHITPHDLRRTSAVAMLEYSHDVREVQALLGHRNLQSTLWYLDHDLRPIQRSTLEIIKRPNWRKELSA